jgi:hypothetical protein
MRAFLLGFLSNYLSIMSSDTKVFPALVGAEYIKFSKKELLLIEKNKKKFN